MRGGAGASSSSGELDPHRSRRRLVVEHEQDHQSTEDLGLVGAEPLSVLGLETNESVEHLFQSKPQRRRQLGQEMPLFQSGVDRGLADEFDEAFTPFGGTQDAKRQRARSAMAVVKTSRTRARPAPPTGHRGPRFRFARTNTRGHV